MWGAVLSKTEMTIEGNKATFEMIIDAQRDFVWDKRFGPDYALKPFRPGYRVKSYSVEFREGGTISTVMGDEKGNEYVEKGRFIKILPGKKLIWELTSGSIPDFRIKLEETFDEYWDMTKYSVAVIFDKKEHLSKIIELGWDKKFSTHLELFGDLVCRMSKFERITG